MSQIYLSALVIALNHVLPLIGLNWGHDQVTAFAQSLLDIGLAIFIAYRRHQMGGITPLGTRV